MSKNNTATRGAGKPALYGKAMKRYQVILNDEAVALALELGNGNLSAGLRALAAANKACSGSAAGRVKNKGSVKAANR